MSRKFSDIPKCKKCGGSIIGGGNGGLCRRCQLLKTRNSYQQTMQAEQKMSSNDTWLKGFNPWKSIFVIPVTIIFLIVLIVTIYMVTSK